MAPQLRTLFGGGRRPPTREEELESIRKKRDQAIRIQEGAYTDQPRVPGYILVNGRWVPDPNYQQGRTGAAAVLPGVAGQPKPEIDRSDVPTVEALGQRPRLESVLSPFPSESRPPWTPAQKDQIYQSLQKSGVRRSDEQRVGELGKRISRLDLEREGMMEPLEEPAGWGGLLEALMSKLSTGSAWGLQKQREAKREKALGVLSERQKELETRQEGVRGRLKETREEEAARVKDLQQAEYMDATIKGVLAQTANVSRPTPGNVIPDPENPGKFIREYRTPDGTVAFTSREMKPAIDARSPEGIASQKELLDHSAAITQRQFERQMAIAQTDAQKTALAMMLQMSKDRLATAKANADAVFQNYQSTPEQMEAAATVLTKETQDNGSMMWAMMEAIGSNPFGPWNNMFQQGGGGGQFEEGDTATGPNGEKMAYRSGRWMRLQ
jgi:hypothetical protein